MMTKFKVGDKIRVIKPHFYYEIDDVVVIKGIGEAGDLIIDGFKFRSIKEKAFTSVCIHPHKVELVQEKQTKNQRIAALENEVAELKLIVQELRNQPKVENVINTVECVKHPEVRIEQTSNFMTAKEGAELGELITKGLVDGLNGVLEFEGQKYRKVDRQAREGDVIISSAKTTWFVEKGKPYKVSRNSFGLTINEGTPDVVKLYNTDRTLEKVDVYELIKNKPLTPNQQRAEVIEKAKKFVEEKLGREQAVPDSRGSIYGPWYLKDFDFVVNIEKRTIIALCKGTKGKVRERGIAKCNPNDVFNEHIGKAIALGRALGLDVSEFEQAVQPNELVTRQIIKANDSGVLGEHQLTKVENNKAYFDLGGKKEFHWSRRLEEGFIGITNDTHAIY